MRNELIELHQRLEQNPDSEKMGYDVCPGGILIAYREADITFTQAVKAIEDWAITQSAKNTEQQVQADSLDAHSLT
jgi:hypothetical protein